MADESITNFEVVDDPDDDPRELAAARNELEERCRTATIEAQEREVIDGEKFLSIAMPNGRELRAINVFRLEDYQRLLAIPFERYVFLGNYIALSNPRDHSLEAAVGLLGQAYLSRARIASLFGRERREDGLPPELEVSGEPPYEDVKLRLGPASPAMVALARLPRVRESQLTLKIDGVDVDRHDNALRLLEKIAHPFLLQIDFLTGQAFGLLKSRKIPAERRGLIRSGGDGNFQFPRMEYDQAPLELYWYARSATGMPLLQFLAYYQVVEYYFYAYSQEQARRQIQAILKDPTFRVERDADIGRVLTAVSSRGRGFGDERTQLRATIHACVEAQDLREYLTETEERSNFFASRQKGLTDHKLPITSKDADLRVPVSDLIYDIRCRIVHTKGEDHEGEIKLLLPFSPEVDLLYHDIELLQFIAKRVLVAASSPLRL